MLSTRCVLLYLPFLLPPPPSGFMYGNVYDEEERFERQAVFPKLLAKHATDFSWVRRVAGNCFVGYFHCFCRIRHRSTEMLSRQGQGEGWYSTNVPTLTTHSPSLWVYRYLGDCLSPQTHCYTLMYPH